MCQKLVPTATTVVQDIHALDLPPQEFHGVFANAVLFHVKRTELTRVLGEIAASLRPNGVLFVSNPRSMHGEDMEKEGDDFDRRYGHYQTLQNWRIVCQSVGLVELEHYYRPPGQPIENQPWLASVWRRP
mmetsp:Transcript_30397/g.49089  ORF Transcript_30397/g.49089 Transcript_30397/m.49089 type:complete len:130 (-) Transcript_30397:650-1039(-)